ncbi:MAG: DUF4291 domain-containing protein [Sandaracinaceae bacterium]|nr:DUF4291 domain-containing protein [Sandaracinaceae bacterium]
MAASSAVLPVAPYLEQRASWPSTGRHILAHYDDESVVVYQAYNAAIADWAVAHQRFGGPWSFSRMSWIKPNFLWMMYRCGWATKVDQERVLAVRVARVGFDAVLGGALESSFQPDVHGPDRAAWLERGRSTEVRMQWDPDHAPDGSKEERRAIQLGLRGETLRRFATEWTREIIDITPFVVEQREHRGEGTRHKLLTPVERVYVPPDEALQQHLRLTTTLEQPVLAGLDETRGEAPHQ